jgi:hypothetical protein
MNHKTWLLALLVQISPAAETDYTLDGFLTEKPINLVGQMSNVDTIDGVEKVAFGGAEFRVYYTLKDGRVTAVQMHIHIANTDNASNDAGRLFDQLSTDLAGRFGETPKIQLPIGLAEECRNPCFARIWANNEMVLALNFMDDPSYQVVNLIASLRENGYYTNFPPQDLEAFEGICREQAANLPVDFRMDPETKGSRPGQAPAQEAAASGGQGTNRSRQNEDFAETQDTAEAVPGIFGWLAGAGLLILGAAFWMLRRSPKGANTARRSPPSS